MELTKAGDSYRAGDRDFERRRDRFYANVAYAMAEMHSIVVPLAGHYGFEPETVRRRTEFYANCAREFGWKGWNLDPTPPPAALPKPGREGKPHEVQKYGNAGIHSYRDQASDAMTWLILNKHLNSRVDWPRTDEKLEAAWSEGNARHTTALALESLFEKAELTPLRSPDFAATPTGGFGPRYVSVSKIVAQSMVQDIRRELPPASMLVLERILVKNEHVWHGQPKKWRDAAFEEIRMALDFVEWVLMKLKVGPAGAAAVEGARLTLCKRWPALDVYFYQKRLRPALHAGKVISRRSKRKAGEPVE